MAKRWTALVVGALLWSACTPSATESEGDAPRPIASSSSSQRDCAELAHLVARVRRGYVSGRAPQISVIPHEPNYVGQATQPTHNGPWDYLASVPLVFYGPGLLEKTGPVDEAATMADVAPTIASLIDFDGLSETDGRSLEAVERAHSGRSPRLVVTVVWDGVGWNALRAHQGAWPYLRRLLREGVSFPKMDIGSSPSVTPPVHATLGTGMWPRRHGIVSVRTRAPDGEFVDPWLDEDPALLRSPTLGDLYDRARDNVPLVGMTATVNWHLGMLGHGAAFEGGDKDPAALINDAGLVYGNDELYELPEVGEAVALEAFAERLDAADGARDGLWEDHDLADPAIRYATPAYTDYQQHVLERLIDLEDFGADSVADLLYVNFKQPDDAFHHWGLSSPEVGLVLEAQDAALRRLVGFLDRTVGAGRWALALTADHGLMPYPEDSGAWPVGGGELLRDVNEHFGATIVERVVSAGLYVQADQLSANGIDLREVARWVATYTAEQNAPGGELPPVWRSRGAEQLFDAVLVGDRVAARSCSPPS